MKGACRRLDWSFRTGSDASTSSPAVVNGVVYVGSAANKLANPQRQLLRRADH